MIVVSDATCLIGLSKIGYLYLLKEMFEKVYIPEEVYKETVVQGKGRLGANEVKDADWIKVKPIKDRLAAGLLEANLSRGEAEVIILAKESNADLVILDEKKARNIAIMNNLNVGGTLGILREAKLEGRIDSVLSAVNRLRETRFWIDDRIYQQILEEER